MKQLIYTLIFLIILVSVSAKIEHFTTVVNLTVTPTTFRVQTGDLQTRTYTCGGTDIAEMLTVNLYENTTCKEEDLFNYLNSTNLLYADLLKCRADYLNTSVAYGVMYGLCYDSNNVTFKERLDTCRTQLTSSQTNYNDKDKEYESCKKTKSYWIYAGIGGVVIGYFIWGRKTFANSPLKGLPPSR